MKGFERNPGLDLNLILLVGLGYVGLKNGWFKDLLPNVKDLVPGLSDSTPVVAAGGDEFRNISGSGAPMSSGGWGVAGTAVNVNFSVDHRGPGGGDHIYTVGAEVDRGGFLGLGRIVGWKSESPWYFGNDGDWKTYAENWTLQPQYALQHQNQGGYWDLHVYVRSYSGATILDKRFVGAILI